MRSRTMADPCPCVVTRGTGRSGTCRSELAPGMNPSQAGLKVTGAVTGPPWRRQSGSQSRPLRTSRPCVYSHSSGYFAISFRAKPEGLFWKLL